MPASEGDENCIDDWWLMIDDWWLWDSENILKTINLDTLNGWIVMVRIELNWNGENYDKTII